MLGPPTASGPATWQEPVRPPVHPRVEQARLETTAEQRRQVLSGGYWLRDYRDEPDYHHKTRVHIFASGVMVPEALRASDAVLEDDVYANVINITSPDLLFADWFRASGDGIQPTWTS